MLEDEYGLLHGTKILLDFVEPCYNPYRVVYFNFFFALVSVEDTLKHCLWFIGVMKKVSERFQLKYVSDIDLINRGEIYGVITKVVKGLPSMLDLTCTDCDCCCFIAFCSSINEVQLHII